MDTPTGEIQTDNEQVLRLVLSYLQNYQPVVWANYRQMGELHERLISSLTSRVTPKRVTRHKVIDRYIRDSYNINLGSEAVDACKAVIKAHKVTVAMEKYSSENEPLIGDGNSLLSALSVVFPH